MYAQKGNTILWKFIETLMLFVIYFGFFLERVVNDMVRTAELPHCHINDFLLKAAFQLK
jgi:hypothetical protein